jgi:hypothetical protein
MDDLSDSSRSAWQDQISHSFWGGRMSAKSRVRSVLPRARQILPSMSFLLVLVACSDLLAGSPGVEVVPGVAHLELLKRFVSDPTWEGIVRSLGDAGQREVKIEKENRTRDERGRLPFVAKRGDDESVTTDFFYAGIGTPTEVKEVVVGFGWKLPRLRDDGRKGAGGIGRGRRPSSLTPPEWNDDKRVAVAVLKRHIVQFNAVGFKVLDHKELSVPGWIREQYRLRYNGVEFTVIVEHEGSGMALDFDSSRGGYVHFTCCIKPEDCVD